MGIFQKRKNRHVFLICMGTHTIISLEVGSLACHQVIMGVDLAKQTHVVKIKGDLELNMFI